MPRAKSGTLVANTVTSVTVTDVNPGGVEIVNRSQTGQIWVTLDGTEPTVAGDDCFIVLGARYFENPTVPAREQVVVKLISSAALDYTVEGNPKWTPA